MVFYMYVDIDYARGWARTTLATCDYVGDVVEGDTLYFVYEAYSHDDVRDLISLLYGGFFYKFKCLEPSDDGVMRCLICNSRGEPYVVRFDGERYRVGVKIRFRGHYVPLRVLGSHARAEYIPDEVYIKYHDEAKPSSILCSKNDVVGDTVVLGVRGVGKTFNVLLSLACLRYKYRIVYTNFHPLWGSRVKIRFSETKEECPITDVSCISGMVDGSTILVLDDVHYALEEAMMSGCAGRLGLIDALMSFKKRVRAVVVVSDEPLEYYDYRGVLPRSLRGFEGVRVFMENTYPLEFFRYMAPSYIFVPMLLSSYEGDVVEGVGIRLAQYFGFITARDLVMFTRRVEEIGWRKFVGRNFIKVLVDEYVSTLDVPKRIRRWLSVNGTVFFADERWEAVVFHAPRRKVFKALAGMYSDRVAEKILSEMHTPYIPNNISRRYYMLSLEKLYRYKPKILVKHYEY